MGLEGFQKTQENTLQPPQKYPSMNLSGSRVSCGVSSAFSDGESRTCTLSSGGAGPGCQTVAPGLRLRVGQISSLKGCKNREWIRRVLWRVVFSTILSGIWAGPTPDYAITRSSRWLRKSLIQAYRCGCRSRCEEQVLKLSFPLMLAIIFDDSMDPVILFRYWVAVD
jgi:hypothetical protein